MERRAAIRRSFVQLCLGTLVAVPGFAQAAGNPKFASQTVLGVPCSEVFERGIDKQDNMRASLIRIGCGLDAPGQAGVEGTETESVDVANINLITGETPANFPHVTQSESMVWSTPNGQTIVVNYNDSRNAPAGFSGVSVSDDEGANFTRLLPSPFNSGHGANFGDPIVVYNNRLNRWFAGDLAGGCGGQGIGLWTSTDGHNWAVGACAHTGAADDRESMWVDENPASPWYGRMYISWNDFNAGQNIFVTWSDNGTSWSTPVRVQSGGFIRNVQLTGSKGDDGTVFIAGMNEGGGGLNNRQNRMYRSLNGGASWTEIIMGPPFPPPGNSVCNNPYFAKIEPIWRHMGWGQPGGAGNGVVHYAYAGRGVNPGDVGDIYYTRSADNGTTWSAPIVLNTDSAAGGNRPQWMPSLSVTPEGIVQVTWYDRRSTSDLSYQYWLIASQDNGLTWGPDQPVSDVISPQPEQPDPNVQACYAGDYNYQTSISTKTFVTWTDGRNPISGHFQQDVYFAAVDNSGGGTIEGTVRDAGTGSPVAGASVRAVGPVDRTGNTGADGFYRIRLPGGSYNMTVTAFGYSPGSANGVVVVDGQATTQNFALAPAPAHNVSGTVTSSASGLPIAGATIQILTTPIPPATTDANGMYLFPSVPEGTYDVQASAGGYAPRTQTGILVNQDVIVNFMLDPRVGPCTPDRDIPSQCDMVVGNLVVNCGFETGAFAPWAQSGDLSFTNVDTFSAHSGNFGDDTGPVGGLGFIAQNLPTTAGATYNLSFWLANTGGPANRFTVSWGGTVIYDVSDQQAFGYTQYCWSGIAPSDSTELKFGFLQMPAYFQFDDVVVRP